MPRSTINGTAIDLDGKEMILDADQDTTLTVDTDDQIDIRVGGSDQIKIATGEVAFNDGSGDVDFRVESNGSANMLFVDGGNNRVNIGHNASVAGKFNVSEAGAQGLEVVLTDADDIDLLFYNRATSAYVKANYNAEQHIFSGHGNQTSNNSLVIDSIGAMTNAAQPAFLAFVGSAQNNIALDSTVTYQFNTEVFDQNNDFDHSTNYRFTAPVTGRYQLNFKAYYGGVPSDAEYIYNQIVTSNRNYISIFDPRGFDAGVVQYWQAAISVLADMDANDTASVIVYQRLGSQTLDITGGSAGDPGNTFSGYLVC